MDAFTLLVASTLASTLMAGTMVVLHRASPRERCLIDWSFGGLLFVIANGLALLMSNLPYWAGPPLINALFFAGHGGILVGVRRHLGRRPGWLLIAACCVLIWLLQLTPMLRTSVFNRMLFFLAVYLPLIGTVIWLLWRTPRDEMKPAYTPLLLIEIFFVAQLAARVFGALFDADQILTVLGNQYLQTVGWLSDLLFTSVATLGCALIVIRHQELALRRLSRTDNLTGWLNRHALQDIAHREFDRSRRADSNLAFLLFDIDHFKTINDGYGHAVGDLAIQHVTALATTSLRDYDARFRIGGEEFVVLIPDAGYPEVHAIAERVREHIANAPLINGAQQIALTVSIGLAGREPADSHWEPALRRADEALYAAKRAGRNCVRLHGHLLAAGHAGG